MNASYADIVEQVHRLEPEAKEELIGLLRAWLVEERRDEILRNAQQADRDHAEGKTKNGSIGDLMADLYAEG